MPRLELNNLLRSTTTPEQLNFINWFYQTFDNRSAANRRILNVEPLFYQGLIAGSEFLVYAVTKLYLCLDITFNTDVVVAGLLVPNQIDFYDNANAYINSIDNNVILFRTDTLNYRYYHNKVTEKNLYFSRFVATEYYNLKFNGYRITLI